MQQLHLKHKILIGFLMFQAMPKVAQKNPLLMIKKYNDSFEFCYNQKKNKEIKIMILKKNKNKIFCNKKEK